MGKIIVEVCKDEIGTDLATADDLFLSGHFRKAQNLYKVDDLSSINAIFAAYIESCVPPLSHSLQSFWWWHASPRRHLVPLVRLLVFSCFHESSNVTIAARDIDARADPDDDGVGWFVASPALMIPARDAKE